MTEIIYTSRRAFTPEDYLADNIAAMVDNIVADGGDKKAFSSILPSGHTAHVSYKELGEASDAIALYLREDLGLKSGEVVGLMALNLLSYPIVAIAAFKAGLKLTNINPMYTADEANHQLKDSGAKALFIVDLFGDKLQAALKDTLVANVVTLSLVDMFPVVQRNFLGFMLKKVKKSVPQASAPVTATFTTALKAGLKQLKAGKTPQAFFATTKQEDTAILQYTGGTTGRSKGAELTHGNVVGNISQANLKNAEYLDGKDHELLLILPLYHVYAFAVGFLSSLKAGTHIVLVPVPRPMTTLKAAFEKFNITIMPGVNTLFGGLLQEKWFVDNPPKSLELCFSGAAPLQPATAESFRKLTGAKIYEGYGLTEGTCIITSMDLGFDPLEGNCGQLIPGTEARIVGEDGKDQPVGERGELLLRGPQIMKGYLNNPEANEAAFDGDWLHTGDVAKFDEDGNLYIVDRMKDMVIVSGFNVFPTDLEDVLTRHSAIADAAVVGVPCPKSGEKLVAYITPANDGLAVDDVLAHCREHLTGYKVPKIIRFVDELPKSPVGKVLRRELRDIAMQNEVE